MQYFTWNPVERLTKVRVKDVILSVGVYSLNNYLRKRKEISAGWSWFNKSMLLVTKVFPKMILNVGAHNCLEDFDKRWKNWKSIVTYNTIFTTFMDGYHLCQPPVLKENVWAQRIIKNLEFTCIIKTVIKRGGMPSGPTPLLQANVCNLVKRGSLFITGVYNTLAIAIHVNQNIITFIPVRPWYYTRDVIIRE